MKTSDAVKKTLWSEREKISSQKSTYDRFSPVNQTIMVMDPNYFWDLTHCGNEDHELHTFFMILMLWLRCQLCPSAELFRNLSAALYYFSVVFVMSLANNEFSYAWYSPSTKLLNFGLLEAYCRAISKSTDTCHKTGNTSKWLSRSPITLLVATTTKYLEAITTKTDVWLSLQLL